jgi:GR25 family glycosyltransferase involved in LPS biosynthesis
MSINKHFDQVYLLNLKRRPDRLLLADKRMKFCDIDYTIFHATDGQVMNKLWSSIHNESSSFSNPSYIATAVSHLSIYNDALSKGYNKILIVEDDNKIHRHANNLFDAHYHDVPDDWKLLYLGYIPLNDDISMWDYNVLNDRFITSNVFKAKNCWGLYAYGIESSLMRETIDVYNESFPMELDRYFVTEVQPRGCAWGITPQLFAADDGFSDNSGRHESNMLMRSVDSRHAQHIDYI